LTEIRFSRKVKLIIALLGGAVDYQLIDADNHYYEAEDAFTRYGDAEVNRFVRWLAQGKRRYILFGNVMQTIAPNPTFNPVDKPGSMHQRLRELAEGGQRHLDMNDPRRYEGVLEPLPLHCRDRDARLAVMDRQGLEKAWMFPTLGVGVEGLNADNVPMTYKLFHAFNQWLDDDWGFDHEGRILGAPAIPVLDPLRAVEELEFVLARGARLIVLRPGPANGRSPADPVWDPFWARVQEADIPVAYHIYTGTDAYDDAFRVLYQRQDIPDPYYDRALRSAIFGGDRTILDTVLSLVLGNLFGRFPGLRIATIELGCAWVGYCMHLLDHAGISITDRYIQAFGGRSDERPSDIFKRHFWVSPFPEEDVVGLVGQIGADRVLFGSDWPHSEGTAEPADYAAYLGGLSAEDTRKIMRENALTVLGTN
jgi:predicted TIM-barrel fold metal-dependent hydrolase